MALITKGNTITGIYLPYDYSANILKTNPESTIQTLLHEYFGHGLYVEHSLPGQEIYGLYRRMIDQFPEYYDTSKLSKEEPKEVESKIKDWLKLSMGLRKMQGKSLHKEEGFAIWMQWYLSEQTGREEHFQKNLSGAPSKYRKQAQEYIDYAKKNGEHALLELLDFQTTKK